jgi:DNA-binding IclR family transcriptional regulator
MHAWSSTCDRPCGRSRGGRRTCVHLKIGTMGRPSSKDRDRIILPDYAEGIQIKTDDEDPRFNNALARGLAILRTFDIDSALLGNLDLAELTGLPKSTVSRLTFTLTQLGYLNYREEVGKYELAAGVVGLAYPYIANQTTPSLARPLMVELAQASRTNIGLGVAEGLSVLYLEYALGEARPNRRQRVGFRVPLIRTAMGRACIAGLTENDRTALYERLQANYPREWPILREQLEDAVAQVQARGWCEAKGTFQRNVHSVAVPFLHPDGRSVMAFNSQGSSASQTAAVMARNGQRLLELVQEVRKRMQKMTPAAGLPAASPPRATR